MGLNPSARDALEYNTPLFEYLFDESGATQMEVVANNGNEEEAVMAVAAPRRRRRLSSTARPLVNGGRETPVVETPLFCYMFDDE